jgi:L-iditol 2-dehydrogenase
VRAVVIEAPGSIELRADVPAPEPGEGEVLVRSRMAGVCRTDLEILHGLIAEHFVRYPCIPGHEWAGVVEAVGAGVDDFEPGDRVICEGMIPCGRCPACRKGLTNLCANYDSLGFTRGGGLGELVLVPRHVVHRLPETVSFASGVLVEPASCVLRGLKRARCGMGESVAVIGIGTMGSLALLLAAAHRPRSLSAIGVRPEELELARTVGAGAALDAQADDVESLLPEPPSLVIETAGAPDAVDLAMRLVAPGGRVLLLGVAGEGASLTLPSDRITWGQMDVIGSIGYTSGAWTRMLELASSGLVDLDPVATHTFPLDEYDRAFARLENPSGVQAKVLIEL